MSLPCIIVGESLSQCEHFAKKLDSMVDRRPICVADNAAVLRGLRSAVIFIITDNLNKEVRYELLLIHRSNHIIGVKE